METSHASSTSRSVMISDALRKYKIVLGYLIFVAMLVGVFLGKDRLLQCGLAVGGIAVLWVLEPIPYHVASFVPLVVFPLSNLIPAKEVATRYMNDDVIRALSGLFISILLQTSKLNRRMALYLLLALGTSVRWLLLCYMWLVFLFSMFVTDAAVTAVMVSLVDTLVAEVYASKVRVRVARLNKAAEEARQHRGAEEARVAAEAPDAPAYADYDHVLHEEQTLAGLASSSKGTRCGYASSAKGSGGVRVSSKARKALAWPRWKLQRAQLNATSTKYVAGRLGHRSRKNQQDSSGSLKTRPLRNRSSEAPPELRRHCAVLRKAFMLALSYSVVYGTAVLLANKTSFVLDAFLQEQYNFNISQVKWVAVNGLFGLVGLVFSWLFVFHVYLRK
ncbi:Na+/dicarboxylate, Na+/tricarboxylate and phosphate transporter, putative [Ixodes scapularis]|uniref:Na+/dicarboxylate, Na+/tricarboxylate and phosphate transporter, putative n=1 Tax=Ixodes scapularis TaxID=6945 RepID=B7QMX2_IXOSC|nr:Na+/dicarboxylate, Na+/tricarboxylate and phosphate transporter, putative [Ixodes scapularis]|eukprot:XP_002400347.1 Na+/dicarboxylate, Na+/tricarboxylate and phosphate transporter, putative [Ixodes scapularis]